MAVAVLGLPLIRGVDPGVLGRETVFGVCWEDEAWLALSLGEKEGASRSPDRLT